LTPLEDLLQQCTVKITLPGGWGTGFFVAPGLILTCAHVVRKSADLQVTVSYSGWQQPLSAIVKAKADDSKTLDLALVELSESSFDHPCVLLDEEPVAIGQTLYSYGYLESYTNAAPVRPVNEGLTGDTPPLLKLQGAQIEKGISGAALLDLKTGKVCGMVKETRAAGFDLGGGAIPTRVILEQFPELRELQRKFHEGDRRWVNLTTVSMAGTVSNRTDRNEKILIDAVCGEVADRLEQSLHNAILIRLDMTGQRSQVKRPWDADLRTASQVPKPVPPGTPIAEVFDSHDIGGKLLLLGNPGAGKTTTMLDLAATLIQRANADPEEPIPVMLNLSSWQNPQQSCTDWLLKELKSKYGVSRKLGKTWLTEKKLLPLLDGLDELPPERQEPVVEAINTWLQSEEGTPRLLVCSRLEEYELYAAKLSLNGAVCLNPLTDEQVKDYLASLHMEALWETLEQDKDLLGLVRAPLLLSVSILANEAIDLTKWEQLGNIQDRLDYLLDAYIVRRLNELMVSKEYVPGKQPTTQQTQQWLGWLAKQLKAQSEDEFLVENMQPSMLVSWRQKLAYFLITKLLIGSTGALFVEIVYWLTLWPSEDFATAQSSLGFVFFLGLVWYYDSDIIAPAEKLSLSFSEQSYKKFFKVLKDVVTQWLSPLRSLFAKITSIIITIMTVVIVCAINGFNEKSLILSLLIFGLSLGFLIASFIVSIVAGLFPAIYSAIKSDVYTCLSPNQGIRKTFRNASGISLSLIVLMIILRFANFDPRFLYNSLGLMASTPAFLTQCILGILIFVGLLSAFASFPILLSVPVLIYLVSQTSVACIRHFALRCALYMANFIPWNYARFLNYSTERRLLQRVGGRYRFIHRLIQERFAMAYNPDDPLAYYNRGLSYHEQGSYTQAIADYNRAIQLQPDFAVAYTNRGIAYSQQGNHTQAIADCSRAIQLQPDFAVAYTYRGAAYSQQGNYTQAIADYTQAIQLQPDDAVAYYNKACTYSLKRDIKSALENLQQAIDLNASFRDIAKTDADLDSIRQDRQFQVLLGQLREAS
jgi:tetratricopeptide (TPR) repeat protein